MWHKHFCLVNAFIPSCENVNRYSMEKLECNRKFTEVCSNLHIRYTCGSYYKVSRGSIVGSLQRYNLKHAAAACCKNNCSVHYRTTSLHHVPTDLRLSVTFIKPGKERLTLPPLELVVGSLASQKLDVLR